MYLHHFFLQLLLRLLVAQLDLRKALYFLIREVFRLGRCRETQFQRLADILYVLLLNLLRLVCILCQIYAVDVSYVAQWLFANRAFLLLQHHLAGMAEQVSALSSYWLFVWPQTHRTDVVALAHNFHVRRRNTLRRDL